MAELGGTFLLEAFDWRTPDRLEVRGRWDRFDGVLGDAVLVVETDAGRRRLPLVTANGPGVATDERRWRAEFAWEGARVELDAARLDLGAAYVDLPPPRPGRRRFGRQLLAVYARDRDPVPAAATGGDGGRLDAALVEVQDEVADARQVARLAIAEADRAREEARRAREQRGADARRYEDAVAVVRRLADGAQVAENEADELKASLREREAELQVAREALDAAREEVAQANRRLEAVRQALDGDLPAPAARDRTGAPGR